MTAPRAQQRAMIEVLYFYGCTNYEAIVSRLPELFAHAGVKSGTELRRVESPKRMQRGRRHRSSRDLNP